MDQTQTPMDAQLRALMGAGQSPDLNAFMANAPQPSLPAFMGNQPMASIMPPEAMKAPEIPAMPSHLPDGSLYSPSRNMWKSPDGMLYNHQGLPLNAPVTPQAQ